MNVPRLGKSLVKRLKMLRAVMHSDRTAQKLIRAENAPEAAGTGRRAGGYGGEMCCLPGTGGVKSCFQAGRTFENARSGRSVPCWFDERGHSAGGWLRLLFGRTI